MKDDQILVRATRLIGRKKFGEAIRLLEPEVVRYHDSHRFYYLLAAACLRSGDYGGALTYFRRAREIKLRDPDVLLGLAVLHLRRGETDRAVELYLEVLEKEPKNRRAVRALDVVRKRGEPEELAGFLESGGVERLFPPAPRPPFPVKAVSALTAAAFLLLAALVALRVVPSPLGRSPQREGVSAVSLEVQDRKTPAETGGAYAYVLTGREILDEFEQARKLFLAYRDEAARVRINRLLESNAAVAVKQKARLLAQHAVVPGFDTLTDRFAYSAVVREPRLYRDVHVVWRGMATNLAEGQKSTDFDLLVGYDTRSALEGIVPVRFDFAVNVDVGRPLEVLGRVALSGDRIRLQGLAVHQAASGGAK